MITTKSRQFPSADFWLFGGIMCIQIMIGGIRFRFDSDFAITVEESLFPFLCIAEHSVDVNVKVMIDSTRCVKPQIPLSGEDLLLEYYQQDDQLLCLAKASAGKYLSAAICDKDLETLECYLHLGFADSLKTLGNLLRLIPMCMILQQKKAFFFHASQIAVNGKGILFTAPAGTGKTTQAKLWHAKKNAKIVCNDRTLIRHGNTYGYPVDGSEPVRSGEIYPLGAIVFLEQGPMDEIRRLRPKEAVRKLFSQLVIASWNPKLKFETLEQLLSLIESYPVYLLRCTPKESAVQCLETQLKEDGVI